MNYKCSSTCETRRGTLLVDVMLWRMMYDCQKLNQLIFLPEQLLPSFDKVLKLNWASV